MLQDHFRMRNSILGVLLGILGGVFAPAAAQHAQLGGAPTPTLPVADTGVQEPVITSYWVEFTSKDTSLTPGHYRQLAQAAIRRRTREGQPLITPADYPLTPAFVAAVESEGARVLGRSRWLNGLEVTAPEAAIESIKTLACVRQVMPLYGAREPTLAATNDEPTPYFTIEKEKLAPYQTNRLGREAMWEAGYKGEGTIVAVFDGGFPHADEAEEFDHLFTAGRVLATYDFLRDETDVFHGHAHGTMTWSNIAGQWNDVPLGMAPEASFLLARTERALERYSEQLAWIEALEWAEANGADIVSSSLGYTEQHYRPSQMDGRFALIARVADSAYARGILVVNAAGNDGDSKWRIINTPADAASVLTVGGINPRTDLRISFSSYGPTADGRQKPEVMASGFAVVRGRSGVEKAPGTSFATPLVAGFAACARQAFPDLPVQALRERILSAGHLHPYYDPMHGYGIPQAELLLRPIAPERPQNAIHGVYLSGDSLVVSLEVDTTDGPQYLFFKLTYDDQTIIRYGVVAVEQPEITLPVGAPVYWDYPATALHVFTSNSYRRYDDTDSFPPLPDRL